MRILHVSDLHLDHEWFDWVASHCINFDLLIIAGDLQNAFSNSKMHDQARAVSDWLLGLRTPTIVCSGNHDYWVGGPRGPYDLMAEAGWLKNLMNRGNIIGVDGETVDFRGIKILVNGWMQVPNVCGGVDIVVSHGPPEGCACAHGLGGDFGDPEIWPALADFPPKFILSGHIHFPSRLWAHWPALEPKTVVLVPGFFHSSVPAHWILNFETMVAVHSAGFHAEIIAGGA